MFDSRSEKKSRLPENPIFVEPKRYENGSTKFQELVPILL